MSAAALLLLLLALFAAWRAGLLAGAWAKLCSPAGRAPAPAPPGGPRGPEAFAGWGAPVAAEWAGMNAAWAGARDAGGPGLGAHAGLLGDGGMNNAWEGGRMA